MSVAESFDDSMRTSEEVEAASSVPALAAIPLITSRWLRNGLKSGKHQAGSGGLGSMAAQRPASLLAESYRVLCNSLLLTAADRPPQLLVVTSAFPSEGKSVSSCNQSRLPGTDRVLRVLAPTSATAPSSR